jgi:hypothetical protein
VGPLRLSLKLPKGRRGGELKTLVTGRNLAGSVKDNWVSFELKSLLDHEVVVIG